MPGAVVNSQTIPYPYPKSCIVQFAKAPVLGTVKTRLQPELGEEGCLALHRQLLCHTFHTLRQAALAPVELSVTGGGGDFFQDLVGCSPVAITAQRGVDLGERMFHAVADRLPRFESVIVVGSDCPFIDSAYLRQALSVLADGCRAVIGPALDGGYVLLGLNQVDWRLFSGVCWGTNTVLESTRQNLRRLQWAWSELPVLADIDRPEDLAGLKGCLKKTTFL